MASEVSAHWRQLGITLFSLKSGVLKCWKCPKEDCPVRDLLRSRSFLLEKRTALKNSFVLTFQRYIGNRYPYQKIKSLLPISQFDLVEDSLFRLNKFLKLIHEMSRSVKQFERHTLDKIQLKPEFKVLTTVPGIGPVLALTIMLETADISRFLKSGKYTSYCRCVTSEKTSIKKSKGKMRQSLSRQGFLRSSCKYEKILSWG